MIQIVPLAYRKGIYIIGLYDVNEWKFKNYRSYYSTYRYLYNVIQYYTIQ